MEAERFHRQELFFGKEGQRQLEAEHVGIVGLGGIGSHVVQALAYLGVRSYVLVDKDIVEETNLNRLVGAAGTDVIQAIPKVTVAQRLITKLVPSAVINVIQTTNRSRQAMDALKKCTFLFGCVDNDGARLVLSELAAAYSIPLLDSATEILPAGGGQLQFGGRVIFARAGEFCLSCVGEIDMDIAKQELETPSAREVRSAHGYGLGPEAPDPAVVSINGVIANLAVTEFLMNVTGLRPACRYLRYAGERGKVLDREAQRDPNCYTCGYLAGLGEQANIYRYLTDE